MQVPGNWESRGLPDFDGVVWFTRTIDVPAAAASGATSLSLGAMRNTGEVWVNGQLITPPPAGGRALAAAVAVRRRRLRCRPARSRPGANRSRRASRTRATTAASSARRSDVPRGRRATQIAIAGPWKYRVERQSNVGALYTKPGELAAHVAFTAGGGSRVPPARRSSQSRRRRPTSRCGWPPCPGS